MLKFDYAQQKKQKLAVKNIDKKENRIEAVVGDHA